MTYLLDSTVLIDWLRGVPEAKSRLESLALEGEPIAVNAISVSEVFSGLAEKHRPLIDELLGSYQYWTITEPVAKQAGSYRYQFARQGIQLSVTDTILAAHAVSRDATLITGNIRDFPMPELKLMRVP